MYDISGQNKEDKTDEILSNLFGGEQVPTQALVLAQNVVDSSSSNVFKAPDPKHLAPSTPGPRIDKVPNLETPHTPDDSLRIITHLGLSDDDSRYVRGISLVGLASEYSVKKLRSELLGNEGKGWAKSEKMFVKKWFRDENKELKNYENGEPQKQEIIIARIPQENILTAVQHWANTLTERGEFVEMQDFENCPEILRDSVVLILGNDSGQGFTREGVRFANREQANSGAKVFVTSLMQGSDKSLSLFQKQELFSCLSGLRGVDTITMGGKERKLFKFSAMDYEAGAEDFGTQVRKSLNLV